MHPTHVLRYNMAHVASAASPAHPLTAHAAHAAHANDSDELAIVIHVLACVAHFKLREADVLSGGLCLVFMSRTSGRPPKRDGEGSNRSYANFGRAGALKLAEVRSNLVDIKPPLLKGMPNLIDVMQNSVEVRSQG